jgi:hypothetical protein
MTTSTDLIVNDDSPVSCGPDCVYLDERPVVAGTGSLLDLRRSARNSNRHSE